MPDQEARIRCRYCGSNNFSGTGSCWQCNRPLLVSQPPAEQLPPPANIADNWNVKQAAPAFSQRIDQSTADKAAISLGLFFPFIGYPVGIVFLMLDDARKAQLGRLTLLWSTIGMVITLVLTLMTIPSLLSLGGKMLPSNTDSLIKQYTGGDSN